MTHLCRGLHAPGHVTRRDLLRASLAGAGLLALGPVGRRLSEASGAPRAAFRRLVVVNLSGGCDTLNVFVPVGLSSYYAARGAIAFAEGTTLPLNGTSAWGLHPSMPKLQALWNAGEAAAVQRVGYPTPNLSHFESADIHSYGVRNGFGALGLQPSGWIARFADRFAPTPLGAVSVGMGRPLDFVGGTSNPLLVSSLGGFRLSGTGSTNARTHRLNAARSMLRAHSGTGLPQEARDAIGQAHDLTDQIKAALDAHNVYVGTTGVVWQNTGISRNLKDVAALVHGGFETRVFYTGQGGYDTHGGQLTTHATLLSQLDAALGSFADELRTMPSDAGRTVWDDVVVVVLTEFGRRTDVNGSAGTDHGHAYAGIVLGGGIAGGVSYGPDLTDADLTERRGYPGAAVDFRSILKEVVTDHLGADAGEVFPEALAQETTLGIV